VVAAEVADELWAVELIALVVLAELDDVAVAWPPPPPPDVALVSSASQDASERQSTSATKERMCAHRRAVAQIGQGPCPRRAAARSA
jgi:hypothetical protein